MEEPPPIERPPPPPPLGVATSVVAIRSAEAVSAADSILFIP
jgi:hypothetical protein